MRANRLAMPASGTDRAAVAAAGVTMVLWASAFVAIRGAGRYVGPGPLALGRVLTALAVLAVILAVRREGLPPRAAWPGIAGFGVLRFGVYMAALNWGEQKVDAGTASMIIGASPVLVALLAGLLLREGFPRRLLAGIAVCCAGTAVTGLAAFGNGRTSWAGVLLCLLAAAASAGSQACQKPALSHASALQVTAFGCLAGTAVLLPFTGQLASQLTAAPPSATLSVLYLGVLPTALAFTTWSFALAHSTAGQMAAATYTIPAIVIVLSWLLLSQLPGPLPFLGGAICLTGAAITRLPRARSRNPAPMNAAPDAPTSGGREAGRPSHHPPQQQPEPTENLQRRQMTSQPASSGPSKPQAFPLGRPPRPGPSSVTITSSTPRAHRQAALDQSPAYPQAGQPQEQPWRRSPP